MIKKRNLLLRTLLEINIIFEDHYRNIIKVIPISQLAHKIIKLY